MNIHKLLYLLAKRLSPNQSWKSRRVSDAYIKLQVKDNFFTITIDLHKDSSAIRVDSHAINRTIIHIDKFSKHTGVYTESEVIDYMRRFILTLQKRISSTRLVRVTE